MTEPTNLTARTIADRLGRGVVRACYPAAVDRDGDIPATIVTRFAWADGDPMAVYYDTDKPLGPRLTDSGLLVMSLSECGCRPDVDLIRSACSDGGCRYDNDNGEIWTEVDASWPEEDAAALVAVLLRLSGYAMGRESGKKKPAGRRKAALR